MSEFNDGSFRNKTLKQKLGTVTGLTLFVLILFGFIIGIYLFGMAGVFELLNIHYTSVWSLILFVVCFFLLASLIELFTIPISEIMTANIKGKWNTLFIFFIIQILSNGLCLFAVDLVMDDITLTLEAGLIVVLLVTILEIAFENRDKKAKSTFE